MSGRTGRGGYGQEKEDIDQASIVRSGNHLFRLLVCVFVCTQLTAVCHSGCAWVLAEEAIFSLALSTNAVGVGTCSISADMRWMNTLPRATLGCELGTATRIVKSMR